MFSLETADLQRERGALGGTRHTGAAQVPSRAPGCGQALSAREGGAGRQGHGAGRGGFPGLPRKCTCLLGHTRSPPALGVPLRCGQVASQPPQARTFPRPRPVVALPGVPVTACPCPRVPPGHRLRVRGRASTALLRQPLPERPHLLQLLEAEGPAQVRGGGRGRGPAPARRGHHAERRVRAPRPRRPDPAGRLLLLRVSGPGPPLAGTVPCDGRPRVCLGRTDRRQLHLPVSSGLHGTVFLMAFCNIAAGSRFLCVSFLFTRRRISLVRWLVTASLARPRTSPAWASPPWAQPGGRRAGAGGPSRTSPPSRPPASLPPPAGAGTPRDGSGPAPSRASKPGIGLGSRLLSQPRPSPHCSPSAAARRGSSCEVPAAGRETPRGVLRPSDRLAVASVSSQRRDTRGSSPPFSPYTRQCRGRNRPQREAPRRPAPPVNTRPRPPGQPPAQMALPESLV